MGEAVELSTADRDLLNRTRIIENLSDLGNGRRLALMAAGNYRFLTERGKWITWTGRRWEVDRSGAIMRLAKKTVISIYAETVRADACP